MAKTFKKYICLRIPANLKQKFYEKRDEIKRQLDEIIEGKRPLQVTESNDLYDEKVFFTVDILYYEKLQELAKRYNKPISKIIRSILLNLS